MSMFRLKSLSLEKKKRRIFFFLLFDVEINNREFSSGEEGIKFRKHFVS